MCVIMKSSINPYICRSGTLICTEYVYLHFDMYINYVTLAIYYVKIFTLASHLTEERGILNAF